MKKVFLSVILSLTASPVFAGMNIKDLLIILNDPAVSVLLTDNKLNHLNSSNNVLATCPNGPASYKLELEQATGLKYCTLVVVVSPKNGECYSTAARFAKISTFNCK